MLVSNLFIFRMQIGPVLFKCLESGNVHTQGISLKICENFVKHKDEYFRTHLNHLIPASLKLSKCTHCMVSRREREEGIHLMKTCGFTFFFLLHRKFALLH